MPAQMLRLRLNKTDTEGNAKKKTSSTCWRSFLSLTCLLHRASRPRPNAVDLVNSNPGHVSRRRIIHRRELDPRPHIDLSQFLQQFGRPTFLDARRAVKHCIFCETHGAFRLRLEGDHHSWVSFNISHLAVPRQMSGNDLVSVNSNPHQSHVGAAITIQGDQMGQAA